MNETDRLEAFSDAVMAVIITIMAFNVKPPAAASLSAVRASLPELLVYVLSFAIIGTILEQPSPLASRHAPHERRRDVEQSSFALLVVLVSSGHGWIGLFPSDAVPSAFYGVVGLASAVAYWVLVRAIIRANGADSQVARRIGSDVKGKLSPALYVVGIGLAFATSIGADVVYAVVAAMWFIPDRRLAPELVTADVRETQ